MRPLSLASLLFLFLIGAATSAGADGQLPLIDDLPIPRLLPMPGQSAITERLDHETAYLGKWEVVCHDSGVSGMHLAITHQNKAILFDAAESGPSHVLLPRGNCRPNLAGKPVSLDCWAHAVELDLETYAIRPLKILTDPWCSSGGFGIEGTLINTGGWKDGANSVRHISPCPNCDWRDYPKSLISSRWYGTQQILDDGSFIVLGGRRSFNYEFVPAERATSPKVFDLTFLRETTDRYENNLYPFVHLSTDGNLFVFANNRSILLNPRSGQILRHFPVLPGGSRNYPASGMSALLPINLRSQRSDPSKRTTPFPVQVLICGGAPQESFATVNTRKIFLPALKSCGRLTITDPASGWIMEEMPAARTIGDMLILPNGDILIINGAGRGCAGWDFARDPVLFPLLYKPAVTRTHRWKELSPSAIPRMYHSSSAVLPDASILVAGSNTNPTYNFSAMFPTEMRVEKFRPPYLDPSLDAHRPLILAYSVRSELGYAESFEVEFQVARGGTEARRRYVWVTMYAPPFTTHGFSMNQRMLVLRIEKFEPSDANGKIRIRVTAPPSAVVAPPGWYMLFVVNKGLPSEAVWVKLKARTLTNRA